MFQKSDLNDLFYPENTNPELEAYLIVSCH